MFIGFLLLNAQFQFEQTTELFLMHSSGNHLKMDEAKGGRLEAPNVNDPQTITVIPDTDYYRELNHMIDFLMYLLREKETLCAAVNKTKRSLDFDLDGEVRLNMCRRKMAEVFRSMARIRGSEVTEPNGGIGYRFNNEGNQISYKCDVRRVTVINFDRNTVRKYASKLGLRADDMSLEIDKCMIGCEVDYEPGFDVNDSFEEVFEKYNSTELQVRR